MMRSEHSESRHSSPPLLRRRLGSELRRLREAAGLRTEQIAERLYCSPSKISRVEKGRVTASVRDVRDMLELYGVSDQQRADLLRLADEARHKDPWWHSCRDVPDVRTFMAFERATNSIRVYESLTIPGLLQVEGYAELVTRTLLTNLSPPEVRRHVELRMARQQLLTREDAPALHVVLDEAAIQRLTGMPQVLGEQLDHLALVARRPNISFQVLPYSSGAHEGMSGPFTILGFPEEADPDVLVVEFPTGELYLDSPNYVPRYLRMFEKLQATALPEQESAAFIAALSRQLVRG